MNKELIQRVLLKILKRMKEEMSEDERKELLNERDENGVALIHYITTMDYCDLIEPLAKSGADINVKTLCGLTPLIIAAAKGLEKCVKRLIRSGAFLVDSMSNDVLQEQVSRSKKRREEPEKRQEFPNKLNNLANMLGGEWVTNRSQHGIMEMILRDMTLKNAVKTEIDQELERKIEAKFQQLNLERKSECKTSPYNSRLKE
mmetsp:Transcript_28663/g.27663  ORF Transcript_28663/g.27663 Transcript_28663/m.27663 type:complete len:202 (-) Transcript_28663:274-879(-)